MRDKRLRSATLSITSVFSSNHLLVLVFLQFVCWWFFLSRNGRRLVLPIGDKLLQPSVNKVLFCYSWSSWLVGTGIGYCHINETWNFGKEVRYEFWKLCAYRTGTCLLLAGSGCALFWCCHPSHTDCWRQVAPSFFNFLRGSFVKYSFLCFRLIAFWWNQLW